MIEFNFETDFILNDKDRYRKWILDIISSEGKEPGALNYIFCDDAFLLGLNQQHLNHDTLTDIISFDYSVGIELHGDIFISVERVRENAVEYMVDFEEELRRVMAHGILHYAGYEDKSETASALMRRKEEEKMDLFHVER